MLLYKYNGLNMHTKTVESEQSSICYTCISVLCHYERSHEHENGERLTRQ